MRSMKRLLCLALATGTLITAMPIQSMASSDYKYITNISLKVDIDLDSGDEINDGDSLGTDSSDSGNRYTLHRTNTGFSQQSGPMTRK